MRARVQSGAALSCVRVSCYVFPRPCRVKFRAFTESSNAKYSGASCCPYLGVCAPLSLCVCVPLPSIPGVRWAKQANETARAGGQCVSRQHAKSSRDEGGGRGEAVITAALRPANGFAGGREPAQRENAGIKTLSQSDSGIVRGVVNVCYSWSTRFSNFLISRVYVARFARSSGS